MTDKAVVELVEGKALAPVATRAKQALAAAGVKHAEEIEEEVRKFIPLTSVEVTKETREEVHANYMALKGIRMAITRASKSAREDAVALSKAVVAEEKKLIALITPVESLLKANRDAYDEKAKAEREAKKNRIANINKKIAEISSAPAQCVGVPSDTIENLINALEKRVIAEEEFQEFISQAEAEKQKALELMRTSYNQAKTSEEAEAKMAEMKRQQEEQAAEIKRQQEEIDRQRREAAEAEQERIAAEKAEQERIAAEKQREEERKEAEARRIEAEKQHRIEAEERRKAQEAARIAEEKRLEAEAEAQRLAEEKRLAEEAEEKRLKAEAEAQRLAEEKRLAELAEKKRLAELEASRPNREKLAKFAKDIASFAETNKPDLSGNEKAIADWMVEQVQNLSEKVVERTTE